VFFLSQDFGIVTKIVPVSFQHNSDST
jgi:hypothetical protein